MEEKCWGKIFSVERFSIHDGPGVRTTVFVKGCNLKCIWCHNPESNQMGKELQFLEKECLYCKRCSEVCKKGVHKFSYNSQGILEHSLSREFCDNCGECVLQCPCEALKILGYDAEVEEVFKLVEKDYIYYGKDGGITISGGEPLLQAHFCFSLLKRCKDAGIRTCIETAGDVPFEAFERLLSVTDLFLFDFKMSDPDEMKKYTGGNLHRILHNLHSLREHNAKIILRCPIIPGINDTKNHFHAIARLSVKEKIDRTEIMPYHNWGKDKWKQTGKEYPLELLSSVSREQAKEWNRLLQDYIEKEMLLTIS